MKAFLFTAAALLVSAPAWAQNTGAGGPLPNPSQNPPSATQPMPNQRGAGSLSQAERSQDTKFVDHVARDGLTEVELGQLAQQKSSNPDVKAFAQRLVQDHSQANQQLQSLAQRDNIQVPTQPDRHENEDVAKLQKLNGAAFDREFVQMQVRDHQKDIQYFQREAKQLKDPELQSFAQQTLPVLEQHLQMAQRLAGQPGLTGSSSGIDRHSSGQQQ